MPDPDPSSLPSPSTREEARYVKNCIGCQQSVPIVAFTIEREPGPFCRDCWEALKLHVAQVNLLNIKADLKLAPSAPEAPTAEAARVRSPQQEEFNGYDVGADLEEWVHHDMDCAWGTGPGLACSCGLSEALAKIDAELTSLRLQAGLKDVLLAHSATPCK